jgi:integrase
MPDPIKKLPPNAKGQVRYRFVIDAGPEPLRDKETGAIITDPATGAPKMRRRQLTVTRDTLKEAKAEYSRLTAARDAGTLVTPSKLTVNQLVDEWLVEATEDVEAATARSYLDAMRYVRAHLGPKPVQQLTEADVRSLIDWMLTSARRIGGKPGTGLSARTVELTLGRLRAVLKLGIRRGLLARNVAEDVKVPKAARKAARAVKRGRQPWTRNEVQAFLAHVANDRLYAVVLLSLIGMRPAEVVGLRWEDVDLKAGTVSIEITRTLVAGEVVEKNTKSDSGERVLPLPAVVLDALKMFRRRQAKERLAAGEAYEPSGRVVVDELGAEVRTDWLRRRTYERMQTAGVRKVRLYDARHACLSWMANNGVPDTVVSAWAGHADLGFTKRVYVHADPDALREGSAKLGELLG